MLNNNVVLFLIDHKHRDLPSAALIGFYLKKKGYDVKYVAYWQEEELIKEYNPKYIVLGKPVYDYSRLAKWRAKGRKWIAMDVEGNPQDIIYEMKINIFPDMSIYWNDKEYLAYKKYYKNKSFVNRFTPHLKIIGCPRIDFHHKNYTYLFETKEEILKRYDLPVENKIITIATSTQDSHFSNEKRLGQAQTRKAVLSKSADYELIVRNMEKLRDKTGEIIKNISRANNDYNIVIKPHPNENVIYWDNLIKELNLKNARIMKGEVINNLLNISDLHIAHNVCTTIFEAMLHQIPTVEIHTSLSIDLYEQEHLNLGLFQIQKPTEILHIIDQILETNGTNQQSSLNKVTSYCNKYFGSFNGKRCFEYAESIDTFIQDDKTKTSSLFLIIINHAIFINYLVFNQLRSLKSTILARIFNHKKPVSEDTKISSNVDVRGRFDNRIKPGDEDYWLRLFNR